MGKVIVAYLLDRFPDLQHLYLVIRPKWDLPAEVRFYEETLETARRAKNRQQPPLCLHL